MPTNNFLPFCPTDTGTNLLTQSDYIAASDRTNGNQPGTASSKLNNKAIRQATFVTSQIAQYMANKLNADVLDNGTTSDLQAQIVSAFGNLNFVSKATSYSLVALTDDVVAFSAVATATLPTAVGNTGKRFWLINSGGGYNLTINTTSAQTIGGLASGAVVLSQLNSLMCVVSNGANWLILASDPPITVVPATKGGTGLATGTSGGLPYFSSSTTIASSGVLANHSVVVGGGAGATPVTIGTGVTGSILQGSTGADPAFTSTPQLGIAGTTKGTLGFAGNTSGVVTVTPAAAAGTYNLVLPITAGTTGQLLTSQGGGSTAMTWTTINAALLSAGVTTAFTASGTFTTPSTSSTSTIYRYIAIGAGGGGGSSSSTGSAGGGGGGGFAMGTFTGVAANTAITITVGVAQAGGTAGGAGANLSSGNTTIGTPVSVTAGVGAGGAGNGGASAAAGGGGGTNTGSPNLVNLQGSTGGNGASSTVNLGGNGGGSHFGTGGQGGIPGSGTGNAAVSYGAGGGGAGGTASGGNGAAGLVLITQMTP